MSLLDNRTLLCDGEATGNISGDTDASPTAVTSASGSTIQGTNATSFQVDDAQEVLLFDQDTADGTFNVDMSDRTCYIAIKQNGGETFANLGGLITLSDGADGAGGDIIGYAVGGTDVIGLPYDFRYHIYKLDVSVVVASPGTNNVDYFQYNGTEAGLDHTAILQVGWGSFNLVKAVGTVPNAWFDGFYHVANATYAVSIQGGSSGTPETMVDVVGDDSAVGMGLFNNPKGSEYGFFGPTRWGGAAADSYFTATDEQWFWIGDNQGGHEIGATHFPFSLVGDSGSINSWVIERVVIVNTGARATFDMSNADMDFVQMTSCTLVDLGALTFPTQDVDKFCNGTTFINCDQMDLQSLDMDRNTFIGTTDANGAIIWDENTSDVENQDNPTFVRNGTHNAIEIAPTGAGPFTYNIDGLIVDGFASQDDGDAVEAEKVFFINPSTLSADININISNGSAINIGGGLDTGTEGFSWREVGSYTGTVTITQTVTLSVTIEDNEANMLEDVFVSIRNSSTNALISEGRTDANGLYEDTGYNYTGDVAVTINVRKSSPGDTRYIPAAVPNTIINTGMTTTIAMTEDTTAGTISSAIFDISKHGVISNDVSASTLTAKIKLPGGSSRKLVVCGAYWDSTVDRTVSSFTFDGNAMTAIVSANSVTEGSDIHEMFLYRYDIPDADSGVKDVVLTLSGAAPVRAIGFAIINLAGSGAEEDSDTDSQQSVTGNPSLSLNNTTQPAIDVMFALTDDMDTFPPAASGVGSIRRADEIVDGLKQLTLVRADRTTTGAHSIGATYDASSKSFVSAGATFAD